MEFSPEIGIGLLVVIFHFPNLLSAREYCIEKLIENMAVEQPGKSQSVIK